MGFKTTKQSLVEIYNNAKWLSRKHPEGIENDVKEFSGYVPRGAKVLDHGCDRGYASRELGQNGYKVSGYDFNPTAIREALEKYGREGIKFTQKDLTKLPGKPKFDAVFSRNVLTDLARTGKLDGGLKGLYRSVKRDGIIYVTTFIDIPEFDWTGKPKNFTAEGIKKRFEKYFHLIDSRVEEEKTEKGIKKRLVLVGRKV